ncbi:MAG: PD-(D/E)XK nuclease family protein [Kiritimatiellales bacterium]
MAKLENTFSWSFSAAADFDECRRRRYWSKYGMWGGWEKNAAPETQKAYQLNKMDNRWGLMGVATENTIMRVLRQHQAGNPIDAETAFETVARPFLRQKWTESRRGEWKNNPKQFCCLREHYYGTMGDEKAVAEQISGQIKNCIVNFIEKVLPRIGNITREQELPVKTPDMGGDPENITWNGIKMYVIPDYAYRIGGQFHIHDWKAGKIKESHREQLGLYALWAREKFRAKPEDTFLYVEYLNEGQVAPFQLTAEDFQTLEKTVEESVAEMTEYLVDFDRKCNEPLPKEEWELAADINSCKQCNFYELCKEELGE